MLRKFWVAGNLPLLTEPFHLSLSPGQSVFKFYTDKNMYSACSDQLVNYRKLESNWVAG